MAGRAMLAQTWWQQAEADLRAAEDSATAGHNEWSCFQAQQAGEKALKAFLYGIGKTSVLTHSLRRLVKECAAVDAGFGALDDDGRLLDQYYIPTRYPNGLDEETAPANYYDRKDAERCLASARSILARVRSHFAS
jgi:HEPN domain-containing protein